MKTRLMLLFVALAFAGCEQKKEEPPKEGTTKEAVKEEPKIAPTSQKIKLTLALNPQVPQKKRGENTRKLADFLSQKTGFEFDVLSPTTTDEVLRQMKRNRVQIAYVSPWAYLKAHHFADADLLAVETIDGKPSYEANWYVAADSKIKDVKGLKNNRIAFSKPTGLAGFLFPYGQLVEAKVIKTGMDVNEVFKSVEYAGSDNAGLRQVLNGKADAAPAASVVFAALSADDQKKLKAIAKTGDVPTWSFIARSDVPMAQRDKVKEALLELSKPENVAILTAATGATGLQARGHYDHIRGVEDLQEAVGFSYPMPEVKEQPVAHQ